jgi:RNA polymerase sigma factor (sigma-70 family)
MKNMTLVDELKLVAEAKENLAAFDQLYQYYLPKIFSFVYARVLNKAVTEDITSQVFLQAVEKIKTFNSRSDASLGSWLYKIASNKVIDYYRKHKHDDLSVVENLINEQDNPEVDVEKLFRAQRINKVLQVIKPRYQEIIALKFYSELDHDEIAVVLNMNKANVALLLHRALKSFQEKYLKSFPESEIFTDI